MNESYIDALAQAHARVRALEDENASLQRDNALLRSLLTVPMLLAAAPASEPRIAELERWLMALPGRTIGLRRIVGGAA